MTQTGRDSQAAQPSQPEAGQPEELDARQRGVSRIRDRRMVVAGMVVAGIALVALVVTAAIVIAIGHRSGHGAGSRAAGPSTPAVSPVPTPSQSGSPAPIAAIRSLLARQSRAVRQGNAGAYAATIDPTQPVFRARERRSIVDLADVPLASWSQTCATIPASAGVPALRRRYHARVWAPQSCQIDYRLTGYDGKPAQLAEFPTFTERHGRWYLASLSDFARRGDSSDTALWDYGPVRVIRRPDVLVLGPPSELATMSSVAAGAQAAIPRVTAVWGRDWARKVVVQVPATQDELGRITDDSGDLDHIVALSSAEVQTAYGAPAPVGNRVSINPAVWPQLGPIGRQVILTHELTHVASAADTSYRTPTWLVEGFADYVGFLDAPVTTGQAAAELQRDVAAGHAPAQLPTTRDFDGRSRTLDQAYEGAWLACRYIAAAYGQPTLVRFYRAVGSSPDPPAAALRAAMRHLLSTTPAQFTTRWRAYLRAQLG